MKDIGLPVENIAGCREVLKCNLEKTVMPRFAVVEILNSRTRIKNLTLSPVPLILMNYC